MPPIPLTGTVRTPEGGRFNGTLRLTLSYSACHDIVDDDLVVARQIAYPIINGALPASAEIVPNTDLQPANTWYVAEYFSASGAAVAKNHYYIDGDAFDIGSAVPSPITTANLAFSEIRGEADAIGFIQAGAGAVVRTVQDKLRERVSVTDFGAVADGSDCHVQIQAALDYAMSANAELVFPRTAGDSYYNLGSTTLVLPHTAFGLAAGMIKITAAKYTEIRKTGAGAFFSVECAGYGFEVENLLLRGDGTAGQIGFHFYGIPGSPNRVGIINASVHDCFFDTVGNSALFDETAGGVILVDCDQNNFAVDNNLATSCGYFLRSTAPMDNCKIRHNFSVYSKSVAIQLIDTSGAGILEISNNNLAGLGGAIYIRNGAPTIICNNEFLAEGQVGNMVRRDYNSGSLAQNAAGISCFIALHSGPATRIHDNTFVQHGSDGSGGFIEGDYAIWVSDSQTIGDIRNNWISNYTIAAIRTHAPEYMAYLDNMMFSSIPGAAAYSNLYDKGIREYRTGIWGFGGSPTGLARFEFFAEAAEFGQFRVVNRASVGQYVGLSFQPLAGFNVGFVTTSGIGLIGANTADVTAAKEFHWGNRHYTAGEKPFYWAHIFSDATQNLLGIGGGSAPGNAATSIEFWTAANPATPTGTRRMRMDDSGGFTLDQVLFANLGTPANGTMIFCADCTIANPCAGGGSGAFAKRLASVWVCD